jgi:transaldolase
VLDYAAYGTDPVKPVPNRLFEDIPEMMAQVIASWGNVRLCELPATTTRGEPLYDAVRSLSGDGGQD